MRVMVVTSGEELKAGAAPLARRTGWLELLVLDARPELGVAEIKAGEAGIVDPRGADLSGTRRDALAPALLGERPAIEGAPPVPSAPLASGAATTAVALAATAVMTLVDAGATDGVPVLAGSLAGVAGRAASILPALPLATWVWAGLWARSCVRRDSGELPVSEVDLDLESALAPLPWPPPSPMTPWPPRPSPRPPRPAS
jgi:hypothetical protein